MYLLEGVERSESFPSCPETRNPIYVFKKKKLLKPLPCIYMDEKLIFKIVGGESMHAFLIQIAEWLA